MNNEDAIKEIVEETCEGCFYIESCRREDCAFYLAIEALRWIPISERLPEKNGRCLVTTDFGDVCMDSFVDGISVLFLGNVTHWKPLPKPYESEGE